MSTAAIAAPVRDDAVPPRWERIGNFIVLLAYSSVVLFTLRYHEKWADEAQAWLIARDLPLSRIWFYELRYEGSPGLWHTILWVAQHWFHAPYSALGYISVTFAIAGICVLLFATPFPWWIRWPMTFTFFFLYQYAVVARSYALFALFCFLAVRQYRSCERPLRFALSLIPLALLTAHGSLLAAGLAMAYAIRFIGQSRSHSDAVHRQFWFAAAVVAVLYVCLFLILFPPSDVEATHGEVKLTAAVAVHRLLRGIREALVDNTILSVLALLVFVVWCYLRGTLAPLLAPLVLVLALYVYADGWEHQSGTVFLSIIAGLAIAWPNDKQRASFDDRTRLAYRVMAATLCLTLCYQVYVAYYTIRRDVRLPYSGATDTAAFLRPLVEQGKVIYGYRYGMVGVDAWFDRNIFSNLSRAYYHHALSEFDPSEVARGAAEGKADYIVLTWWSQFDPKEFADELQSPMASWGYYLDHVSDGYLLTKTGYSNRQIYLVFRRAQPN